MRAVLAAVVIVVFGLAVAGVGMGSPPPAEPGPAGAKLAAAKASLGSVHEGAAEFESEGCDACHTVAATGAGGRLGPRLDTLADDDVQEIEESITDPDKAIVVGYEGHLMPGDYTSRLKPEEIKAIATFLKKVSVAGKG